MAIFAWYYIVTSSLQASTWVGVLQFVLLVSGINLLGNFVITSDVIAGIVAYYYI